MDIWDHLNHFNEGEKWGKPDHMDHDFLMELESYRRYVGRKIHIHCGWEKRKKFSYHDTIPCPAADLHVEGLHPVEMFLTASRFKFTGVGVYPWWHNPGIHLDMRPLKIGQNRAMWGSTAAWVYVRLDRDFLFGVE